MRCRQFSLDKSTRGSASPRVIFIPPVYVNVKSFPSRAARLQPKPTARSSGFIQTERTRRDRPRRGTASNRDRRCQAAAPPRPGAERPTSCSTHDLLTVRSGGALDDRLNPCTDRTSCFSCKFVAYSSTSARPRAHAMRPLQVLQGRNGMAARSRSACQKPLSLFAFRVRRRRTTPCAAQATTRAAQATTSPRPGKAEQHRAILLASQGSNSPSC